MRYLVFVGGFVAMAVGFVWLLVAPAGNAAVILPLMLGGFAAVVLATLAAYIDGDFDQ